MTKESWLAANTLTPDKIALARRVVDEIRRGREPGASLRAHALPVGGVLGKSFLVAAYNEMVADGTLTADTSLFDKLRMKPVRTLSGVTTVTVLTKPYPCPGKCIFFPEPLRELLVYSSSNGQPHLIGIHGYSFKEHRFQYLPTPTGFQAET